MGLLQVTKHVGSGLFGKSLGHAEGDLLEGGFYTDDELGEGAFLVIWDTTIEFFANPHAYSIPSPAISQWNFGVKVMVIVLLLVDKSEQRCSKSDFSF